MSDKARLSRRDLIKGATVIGAAGAISTLPLVGIGEKVAEAAPSDAWKADLARQKRAVDKPPYEVVGPVERVNEMDIVFARYDYVTLFPERAAEYFPKWPKEVEEKFKQLANLPGLGGVGNEVDRAAAMTQPNFISLLGGETVVDGDPAPNKVELDPKRAAEKIRGYARHLGADLVAIGPLKQEWIYSHVGCAYAPDQKWGSPINQSHKYAISLGFAMDPNMVRTGPVVSEMMETMRNYVRAAVVAVQLASFIRSLGYPARAHHFSNYQVLCVPVAIDGGMGEMGRNGFLVTKEYGSCLRLSTVTCDLPMELDKPVDLGVRDFCVNCKLCAEHCPSGAIPMGEMVVSNGVKKWQIDPLKCYTYWNEVGTDCGTCIAVCPWVKPQTWLHKTAADLSAITPAAGKILTPMEKLFYGEYEPREAPAWMEKTSDDYKKVDAKYRAKK